MLVFKSAAHLFQGVPPNSCGKRRKLLPAYLPHAICGYIALRTYILPPSLLLL